MISFFSKNKMFCVAIFIEPTHISQCLSIVEESLQNGSYFIQLGSEKGDHLKIYYSHLSIQEIKKIKEKIIQIYALKDQEIYEETGKELLFSSYKNGTLLTLNHIDSTKDFYFKNVKEGEILKTFLMASGYLFLQSLKEHAYGFSEKKRVNFSLFLLLLASSEFTKSSKNVNAFLKRNYQEAKIPDGTIAQLNTILFETKESEVGSWENEFRMESEKIIDQLGILYYIKVLAIILDLKNGEKQYLKSVFSQFLKSIHIKV
jgi:hypothetical protein